MSTKKSNMGTLTKATEAARHSGVPRPDLLPSTMGGSAAQAKAAPKSSTSSAAPWPGAPRPELLPGAGQPNARAAAAQPKAKAAKSSPLAHEEHRELERVAGDFVHGYGTHAAMSTAQKTAFKAMTAVARRAWMRGGATPPPAPSFRVGDVVERVGAKPLEQQMLRKYGKGTRVLGSAKLRLLDAHGNLHNDLCELDAVVVNAKGKVVCLVSAKLNPGAVHPATDTGFLARYYTWPTERVPGQEKVYRKRLVHLLGGNPNEGYMNGHDIVGLAIEYEEGGKSSHESLTAWVKGHPLAGPNAAAIPVIGLTPKPTNADQVRANLNRGDVQLGPNPDELLDMLAAEMLKLM